MVQPGLRYLPSSAASSKSRCRCSRNEAQMTFMRAFGLAALILVLSFSPALAQQYAARHIGDVVQLEDTKNQTVVSVIPSVGNIAFEMKVKGINVLRWP